MTEIPPNDNSGAMSDISPDKLAQYTSFIGESVINNLPYLPTDQQVGVIAALSRFVTPGVMSSDSVFLLCGYAGTGKTSLMGALVKTLSSLNIPVVLMAPTGRAAKVFGRFAGKFASTIHRRIYRPPLPGSGDGFYSVADNQMRRAVFIVDEASMIGAGDGDGRPSLLEDLIYYVYSGEDCRMILLGDTAQLPPVGCVESPAMNPDVLRSMGLKVTRAVMSKTVRQASSSGILYNATLLRRAMSRDPLPEPVLYVSRFDDVQSITGEELEDAISSSYSDAGIDDTIVVTRSNRRALDYNRAIRARILDREEELCRGERIMVAKNNYLWSAKVKGLDFIANGDIATIERIISTEEKYGLRWADVVLSLTDRDISVECKIMLDTLQSETPSLETDKLRKLANDILTDPDIFTPSTPMQVRMKMLKTDPYFNALQVKYAYAVTCHKAQGGQWSDVYVDMAFISLETPVIEFYRWLYTSTTRAVKKLYYISPGVRVE